MLTACGGGRNWTSNGCVQQNASGTFITIRSDVGVSTLRCLKRGLTLCSQAFLIALIALPERVRPFSGIA